MLRRVNIDKYGVSKKVPYKNAPALQSAGIRCVLTFSTNGSAGDVAYAKVVGLPGECTTLFRCHQS